MGMQLKNHVAGATVVGLVVAVLFVAEPSKASDLPRELGAANAADVTDDVDYRAPGVSFRQFGSAAKELVDNHGALRASDGQRVFTRAFAWAVYEYAYNRPNFDRWLAQLSDERLQEVIQQEAAAYVSNGRPPIANPLQTSTRARFAWNSYAQASLVAVK